MADYDFHKLHPCDFERMCCEILSIKEHCTYHTFREGRDGGIDILKADDLSNTVIFQCKRYANRRELFDTLRREEVPKVNRLSPSRYGLMTSVQLTPSDKQRIKDLFAPHLLSLEDVYGACDLNALLEREDTATVVNHYPALWLSGFQVLRRTVDNDVIGRSEDFAQRTLADVAGVVWTEASEAAQQRLEKEHVVVLTGDPGIGKTVTAKLVFARCVTQGYEPVVTFNDVNDLERLFANGQKQVFFFDDFLGQQVLEAAFRTNDRGVCEFIRRVQGDDSKRFILTSRTVVINQGICDVPTLKNFWRNAPSYFYCVHGYSTTDRACILLSLMMSSSLSMALLGQLLKDRSYWKVIEHRNFNPRIVDLILSDKMVRKLKDKDNLLDALLSRLDSPKDIWKDAFENALTPEERLIVWCVFLMPNIKGNKLHEAFSSYLMTQNISSVGDVSFERSIATLVDSMLTRKLNLSDVATYELRNPSVGDFLMSRMSDDVLWVGDVMPALNDHRAVDRLRDVMRSVSYDRNTFRAVSLAVVREADFSKSPRFVMAMWRMILDLYASDTSAEIGGMVRAANIEKPDIDDCDCLFDVLWMLDDNGVDLVRGCRLSLSCDFTESWIRGCEAFESVAHAYGLLVKYGMEMPSNMADCLAYCMRSRAWDIAGDLPCPDYETDDDGVQYISDEEKADLRAGIEDGIRRMIREFSIPEAMLDIAECARGPDLDQLFGPPSGQFTYGEGGTNQVCPRQERDWIDRLFADFERNKCSMKKDGVECS